MMESWKILKPLSKIKKDDFGYPSEEDIDELGEEDEDLADLFRSVHAPYQPSAGGLP